MDPAQLGLNKELISILNESSKLAKSEKLTAAEEGCRVALLQRKVQRLFADEAFKKQCSAGLQGSLKTALAELDRSFHTSVSRPRVAAGCDLITTAINNFLTVRQTPIQRPPNSPWNQLWNGVNSVCSTALHYMTKAQKPHITSSKDGEDRLRRAIRSLQHEDVQKLFNQFRIDRKFTYANDHFYISRTIFHIATPELMTVFLRNNFLDLQSPSIPTGIAYALDHSSSIVTIVGHRNDEDTVKAFQVLVNAGYNPNRRYGTERGPDYTNLFPLHVYLYDTGVACKYPQLQALIDLGFHVNPDPSDCESPFFTPLLRRSEAGAEVTPAIETLIFNGALVSPGLEKRLKAVPVTEELLAVREEALEILKKRMQVTLDLGEISRIPALRIQLLQLCRERQVARKGGRVHILQKEFAAMMTDYEKLMGKDLSSLLAASDHKGASEIGHKEMDVESAAVVELRNRFTQFLEGNDYQSYLKTYSSHLERYSETEDVRTGRFLWLNGHPEEWPKGCSDIFNAFKTIIDPIFVDRLLLSVSSSDTEDFRYQITRYRIRTADALNKLFIGVCTQCPYADFVSTLLQHYAFGYYGSEFLTKLLHSLSESLQGRGRSLEEARRIIRLLAEDGLDLNCNASRQHLIPQLNTLNLDPQRLEALLQELINLGVQVNPEPEGSPCPFLEQFVVMPGLDELIFNGAILSPEVTAKLPSTPYLQELLHIREAALVKLRSQMADTLGTITPFSRDLLDISSEYTLDLWNISRTPVLREELLRLCRQLQTERTSASDCESEKRKVAKMQREHYANYGRHIYGSGHY